MSKINTDVKRRGFFTAVAAGGAATLAPLSGKAAPQPAALTPAAPQPSATMPPAATVAAEARTPPEQPVTEGRSGSDFMVDVIKNLQIDYIAAMPGSTFRGLHESVINYGGNRKTEMLS